MTSLTSVEPIKQHYNDQLYPRKYNELCRKCLQDSKDGYQLSVTALYETFKSGKFQGTRLLDIGSGATVHNIASASSYFSHIVLSDYLDSNLEELRKWLRGGHDMLDWSFLLRPIAEIESYSDLDFGVKEIEDRIRAAVKYVVHCDVLADQVVTPEVGAEFDVIISMFTLETACPDHESFVEALKKINRLLCPGGGLILSAFTEQTFWFLEEVKYHHIYLTEDDLAKDLKLAGFGEATWEIAYKLGQLERQDYCKLYYVSVKKIKNV